MRPLLDLQRVDSAIDRLTFRRANLPEQQELNERSARRAEVAGEHAERGTALEAVTRDQTKLENDISLITEKINHEQARLYSGEISNPKELSSIQAELDALRRRKAHLEDQVLELLEQREALEAEVGELSSSLATLDAEIADATERRDAATVEIDEELAQLTHERTTIVPTLHPEIVELYEELRAKKDGVGVGALERGTCRACGLPLSPVALDEIKRSDDPLVRCENCRRLLVIA